MTTKAKQVQTYTVRHMGPRSATFRGHTTTPKVDPFPHIITEAEAAEIEERMFAGASPRMALIRKLVRVCDERLAIIKTMPAWEERVKS